ncbi:MAG: hypothetical protein JJD98_00165 [Polaromonas sp.]|nr:hypothetical protein [Polaromonas sp.]
MAVFGSDSFTGTSGTTLPAYSGNWVRPSWSGAVDWKISDANAAYAVGASCYVYHTAAPASADYTVKADVYIASTGGSSAISPGVLGRLSTSAATYYFARLVNSGGGLWRLYKRVNGTWTQFGSDVAGSVAAGESHEVKLSMVGTTIALYKNGEASPAITATDGSITAAGLSGLGDNAASTATTGFHIDNFSAYEAGGGATYTLAADSTALTLAGQDAGLIASRILAADTSALTLAGQDAALTAHRRLAADGAALTLAGQDATLTYTPVSGATYTLTAESGALTLTGQDAALIASRRLAADSAAFDLALQDAGLSHGYVMAAASGDYALTGQDAVLIASRRLAAESASMTLAGQDAVLTYSNEAPAPVAGAMAGNRAATESMRATRLQAGARAGRTQTSGRPAR